MKRSLIIFIHFIFTLYYGYAFYIFYKLNENSCECEKLEKFKKEYSFTFLFYTSLLFLLYNFFYIFKLVKTTMNGGGKTDNIYYIFITIITIGYLFSFIFDYVLLNFFSKMKYQKCPCQLKNREQLIYITYPKIILNITIYLFIVFTTKKIIINKFKK